MSSRSPNEYTGEGTNDSGESEQGIPLHLLPFDATSFREGLEEKLRLDHDQACRVIQKEFEFPFTDFLAAFPTTGTITLLQVIEFADCHVRDKQDIILLHDTLIQFLEEDFQACGFTQFSPDHFVRSAFDGVLERGDWREIFESVQNADFKESAQRALNIAQRELRNAEEMSTHSHRRLLSGIIDDCLDRDREDESITANIIQKNPEIIAALRLLLDSKESLTMKQILSVQPCGVALGILKLIYFHALPDQVKNCISSIAERKKGRGTFSSYVLAEGMEEIFFSVLASRLSRDK